jgi:oxygen-independent coproporphyrinogen-3 oxidase
LAATDALVNAINSEIDQRQDYLNGQAIATIYFGGGTPSLLHSAEIGSVLQTIAERFSVNTDAEITLEANPEDLTKQKLSELKALGINRLSLGTQSFIDAELKWMNRMHTAQQAITAIEDAQRAGFNNISIDLIFGLPDQNLSDWQHNIDTAISLNIQHISSYGLTVEERTVLNRRIRKGEQKPPSESLATDMFRMNMEQLPKAGFEQYEISNFASDENVSRHNSSYWQGAHYLGIGPSAHSFNGLSRQWNVRSNAAYISKISNQIPAFKTETLSEIDRLNEHIMTGLRTKWGIRKEVVDQYSANSWKTICERSIRLNSENFILTSDRLVLSDDGKLLADHLSAELFF